MRIGSSGATLAAVEAACDTGPSYSWNSIRLPHSPLRRRTTMIWVSANPCSTGSERSWLARRAGSADTRIQNICRTIELPAGNVATTRTHS